MRGGLIRRAPLVTLQSGKNTSSNIRRVRALRSRSSRLDSRGCRCTRSQTSWFSFAALFAIWSSRSGRWIAASGVVGMAALYLMVNPSKASFSIAPTMIVCAVAGFLTNILASAPKQSQRIMAAALVGLLLGLAVSFRIPNLFLSAGYFLVLLAIAVRSRESNDILRFVSFGAAYLFGLVPTLI